MERIAPGSTPRRRVKAPLDTPRRAMDDLLGNAVRFGIGREVTAAGQGIETVLSARQVSRTCRCWRRSRQPISPPAWPGS
ncbi:hypothetical protein MPLSOD_140007 [Mesorhizobium sp. SOD10]|nr:hypothetical protein MPLSOD_140007 [Mesorhizobium sp. SOD10]